MNRSPKDVIDAYTADRDLTTAQLSRITGYSRRSVRRILSPIKKIEAMAEAEEDTLELSKPDATLVSELHKLRKRSQKLTDQLRVLRREARIDNRYIVATEEYASELCKLVQAKMKPPTVINSEKVIDYLATSDLPYFGFTGVLQLSDLHLNELIDLPHNKYDFRVASKRLEKFVTEAISYFKLHNIAEVYVILCGDFINSDRRLEELLNMATNRTRATLLAVELLSCVISHLKKYFKIKISYVTGNESRVSKEITHSDISVSDNYDTMIFEILKMIYKKEDIDFIDPNRPDETVIRVGSKNILVTHGGTMPKESLGNAVQKVKGKYASLGIVIDYMLFGHFHDCSISDFYARSSSLCGANAYSDSGLNLASRASQLIHIVSSDSINSIKIDLQNTDGFDGYDIDEELEAYNTKSVTKVIKRKTI